MFNQFNVENKWYTFTDKIMSVSGELFVENDVDISGNLAIKGSLGLLDSTTNNINYGTSGSVLTSNGSGSVPTWEEPYYFSATSDGANGGAFRITTVDDSRQPLLHNSALGTGGAWTTNIETTGKNQFDETTAQWTCPKTGIYNITIRCLMNIDPFPNGNIGEVYLYLFKNTGGGFTTVIGFASRTDETESGTEPITTMTLQITGLFSLNEGDKVRPEVMKKSDDTQQLKCGRFGYDPQFSIHKIG